MKKLHFDSIYIEGFRSIVEPIEFKFHRIGLHLIKGKNGAGKTSIFEALVWCLYGHNLKGTVIKKVASWPELRSKQWKGTVVNVTFHLNDVVYNIERQLDYTTKDGKNSNLLIFKNGKEITDDLLFKKDAQQYIINLLGMDYQAFMNSIMFGQRMAKLIESSNDDKRSLFERLFEMDFIRASKEKGQNELNELDQEYHDVTTEKIKIEHKIEKIDTEINHNISHVEEIKSQRDKRLLHYKESIIEKKEQIKNLTNDLKELKEFHRTWNEDQYVELKEKYEKLYAKINKYNENYQILKGDKQDIENKINTEKHIIEIATKEIDNIIDLYNSQVSRRENMINEYENSIKSIKEKIKKEESSIDKKCPTCTQDIPPDLLEITIKNAIKPYVSNLKIYEEKLENLKKESIKLDENMIELNKKKIKKSEETINKLNETLQEIKQNIHKLEELISDKEYIEISEHLKQLEVTRKRYFLLQKENKEKEELLNKLIHEKELYEKEYESVSQEEIPDIDELNKVLIDHKNKLEKEYDLILSTIKQLEKDMEAIRWWLKVGFSFKGLPSYIFQAMLHQLNENIVQYADRLGISIQFGIDLSKASKPFTTICSIGDKINKDYEEFSGGEKQRLDIVLIFAMHDLINVGNDVNILILDEVFEGLDEIGSSAVFDLIRIKASQKCVYVITHSSTIDGLYSSTINVHNKNGITKIEENEIS